MPKNPYELLNVSSDATPTEISAVYKKLMLKNHPDKVTDPEQKSSLEELVKDINEAYSTLMRMQNDPQLIKKNLYDTFAEKKEEKKSEFSQNTHQSNTVFVASSTPSLSREPDRGVSSLFTAMFKKEDESDYIRTYSNTNKAKTATALKTAAFRIQGDRDNQEDFSAVSYDIVRLFKTFDKDWQRYLLITLFREIQPKYFSQFFRTGAAVGIAFTWRSTNEKGQEVAHVVTAHVGDVLPIAIMIGQTYKTTWVKRLVKPHNPTQGKDHYMRVNNYGINMTRSMGDVYLQKAKQITCEPELSFHTFIVEPDSTFHLMVACDGFTDYVDEAEMKKIAWEYRNASIEEQINAYGDFAFTNKNSSDNISIILTGEELALLDCDGHGGKKVAQIMSQVGFNELKQKMIDILALSAESQKRLMIDFNLKSNAVFLKTAKREKKIAELCELKIAEHSVISIKPKFFPNAKCLIIISHLKQSPLLNDIEEYLVESGLSYSPQEEYYEKGYDFEKHSSPSPQQLRLVIPLNNIETLPDVFDIFLICLENLLKNYVSSKEELIKDIPFTHPEIITMNTESTVKAIFKTYDSLVTADEYDFYNSSLNHIINFIENKNIKIKRFKTTKVPKVDRLTSISSSYLPALPSTTEVPAITFSDKKDEAKPGLTESKIVSLTENKTIPLVERKIVTYDSYADVIKGKHIGSEVTEASGMSGGGSYSQTIMGKIQMSPEKEEQITIKFTKQVDKSKMNISVMDFLNKQTLSCPYIVKLKGLGYSDYYDAMIITDNAELGTLDRFLAAFYTSNTERLSYPILLKIAHDIAQGLAYLHKLGISHNDLRTEEIYLDKNLTAKIAGLSYPFEYKDSAIDAEPATALGGSESCANAKNPPEFFSFNRCPNYTQRDVYAFGLILRELFNKPPHQKAFSGVFGYNLTLLKLQGRKEFIPADCPREIQEIMKKCWEMHPENRYTAEELAAVFRELLAKTQAKQYNFQITFPAEYNTRVMGQHRDYVNEELKDASSQEKLIDLLFKTLLLTPQNYVFVMETPHIDRLWQEYQALVMAGLDNEEYFAVIKKYLPENVTTKPLIADMIALLDACSLRGPTNDVDCCHILLQSENRADIYNVLVYLIQHAAALCTYQNFISLIYLDKGAKDLVEKLKQVPELNQTAFNGILSGKEMYSTSLEYKKTEPEILTSVEVPASTLPSPSEKVTQENIIGKPMIITDYYAANSNSSILFKPLPKKGVKTKEESTTSRKRKFPGENRVGCLIV